MLTTKRSAVFDGLTQVFQNPVCCVHHNRLKSTTLRYILVLLLLYYKKNIQLDF